MNKKKKKKQKDLEAGEQQQPVDNVEVLSEGADEVTSSEPEKEAGQGMEPEDELERLKRDLQEAENKFIRSRADLENYRKRAQRETAEAREYSKVSTIEQFLPVFDHFQMAMYHVGENPDVETLKQGMDMILKEFSRTFDSLGVKSIDATGDKFDPNIHEAMSQEPSDEIPAGHVLRQWKCGYRIGERLLRPATVVVSSGPAGEASPQDNNDEDATS